MPKPLSADQLREVIEFAIAEGTFRESFHAVKGHPERNISLDDVLAGLEEPDWSIEATEYDSKHQNIEYTIKTRDIDGDELHIRIAHDRERAGVKVISRW